MPKVLHLRPRLNEVVRSWYPWITSSDCNILDRNLNRKVELGDVNLTTSEILTALKWFGCVPEGFRSEADETTARFLSRRVGHSFSTN